MKGLRAATSFLTRVDVGADVRGGADLARGLPWFPVVGGLIGVAVACVYAVGRSVAPSIVASVVAIGVGVWVTRAFHEDGLADTADALGGSRSKEDALRILKDPALGTYGVVALVTSLLIRMSALADLQWRSALFVLPAAHALSRGGAAMLIDGRHVATDDGLGASYASGVTPIQRWVALFVGAVIGVVALGPLGAAAVVSVVAGSWAISRAAKRRIGGITGDVLGTAQQVGEVLVLLLAVVWIRESFYLPDWITG